MSEDTIEHELFLHTHEISFRNYHSHLELESKNICDIKYEDFLMKYMARNRPIILKNVSNSWTCTKEWILGQKSINYDIMIQKYGDEEVPVANCDDITFNSQNKINMKLNKYMEYMKSNPRENILYLKDWHLRRSRPHELFYEVPSLFGSDWLNEYAMDKDQDDFMFVYLGPKNSWTPLHVDVYNSYSWSVNIIGQKKWLLLPPGEEVKLMDNLGNLPMMTPSEKIQHLRCIEVIQNKGDAIFVPSGWHHQVTNLMDTISINHNWINACNVHFVWEAIQKTLTQIEHEIIDLKDSEDYIKQCQIILKSLFGMDFKEFSMLLCYIGHKRLKEMNGSLPKFNKLFLSKNHILFDLKIIKQTIDDIIQNPVINHREYDSLVKTNLCALSKSIENYFALLKE